MTVFVAPLGYCAFYMIYCIGNRTGNSISKTVSCIDMITVTDQKDTMKVIGHDDKFIEFSRGIPNENFL
jgi:hypothetical protein